MLLGGEKPPRTGEAFGSGENLTVRIVQDCIDAVFGAVEAGVMTCGRGTDPEFSEALAVSSVSDASEYSVFSSSSEDVRFLPENRLEYLEKARKMKLELFEENHEQVKATDGIIAGCCDRDTFSGQRHQ